MTYAVGGLILLGLMVMLEVALFLNGVTREAFLAWNGVFFWWVWFVIVFISYTRWSNLPDYRRIFGSNERRWCWLMLIVVLYSIAAFNMGRGQPLYRGVAELVSRNYKKATTEPKAIYVKEQSKNAAKVIWDHFSKTLELDKFQKALNIEAKKEEKVRPVIREEPERPYYGLVTWSHWLVFLAFWICAIIYGLAARREELLAWIEKRRRERPIRAAVRAEAPAEGRAKVPGWWLAMDGVIEILAEVLGSFLSTRLMRSI